MRNLFTKLMTSSMIAGAALAVSACHHDDAANNSDTNMTDMNTMDSSAGMTNDMSATDSMGNSGAADNSMMAGNDMSANSGAPSNQM
jgi:hypothetical protein